MTSRIIMLAVLVLVQTNHFVTHQKGNQIMYQNHSIQQDTVLSSTVGGNVEDNIVHSPINVIPKAAKLLTQCLDVKRSQVEINQQPIKPVVNLLQHQVVTPVKPNRLYYYLHGYDDFLRQTLVSGFKFGFHVNNFKFVSTDRDNNSKSACIDPSVVDQKISKECKMGRVWGPLESSPYTDYVISPLGLRPKKQPGEFRVIHNLSHPIGSSVNDGIPREFATVKYATVSDAISHILSFGSGAFLAKTDIKSAYRIVPVHPSDYRLFGFKWKGSYYFDKCLPMGCASSCQIFEMFSSSLEWIVKQHIVGAKVIHVLDDFLFIGPSEIICQRALDTFIKICEDIGVPLAPEKTEGPSQVLTFLGIQLDTKTMCASLPEDKVEKFSNMIHEFMLCKSVTLTRIQSLCGMLNFLCSIIVPARAFIRSLYSLQVGVAKPYYKVKITNSVKKDLAVWQSFLKGYNYKTFFLDFKWRTSEHLQLFTDAASTIGFGAIFNNKWTYGLWDETCFGLNIALLELYPIVLAFYLWGEEFKNQCIIINKSTCQYAA